MEASFKKYVAPLVIAIVLLSNLAFGLTRLGNYSSVDEPYWTYGRITKFWNGIKAHNWKTTSVNDKPGITVAIISGAGLIKIDPMPYKSLRGDVKTEAELKDINDINFYFRLPIYLFCVLLLPFFYLLLKKLFDETTALIAFVFIGLSPILLGMSLIINPDSLLWLFLPLSLLSYFVFQKQGEHRYLYVSGMLLGAALLTKYVANILYVFFFFLPFLDYMFSQEKPPIVTYLKQSLRNYLILVAISMLIFFVFYPATWVNPNLLLQGTFLSQAFETTWPLFVGVFALVLADIFFLKSQVTVSTLNFLSRYKRLIVQITAALFLAGAAFVLVNTYTSMSMLDSNGTLASPKGIGEGSRLLLYADRITADIYSLIFAFSPLVLFSFLAALIFTFRKKWCDSSEAKIVFYLTLFILFYYLASTVNNVVATVRYQITLYPLAFIVAAIGLAHILSLEKVKKYLPSSAAYFLIIALSITSLFGVKPFYFAYTSSLLPEKYFVNLKDMGDGSYEAAAYLNSLPQPEKLTVWSDKGAVCAVFKGKCIIGFSNKRIKDVSFDYVVVSSGRKSRTLKLAGSANNIIDFKKAYATDDTVYTVTIGGRSNNYVKVIEMGKLRANEQ
ncbi:MAG: glycosyltransferase family 39 protein [Candidatus Moraniibacteriota bacterium]